ncbi:hypothetical protein BSL82_02425 [Tardibacter chloracetimidivorans]|uniref:Uncharacterized protein n=1 Tax=Tardibacter chloracetimidivorans TaxID=1921510 RepID=A0A1L3ZRQ1_9SPHN|nr:hypothetical protein [Tardibacter chloracetimidivorans]API58303.1 hypothetical protein BSL82_02425 [Tardibacter chloracetimidivorans]
MNTPYLWPVDDGPRPDRLPRKAAPGLITPGQDEDRPVMVDDWMIVAIDDANDTGELIGTAASFGEAYAKANAAPQHAESGRWIAVARISFMQTRGPDPSRPTRLWSRAIRPDAPKAPRVQHPAPPAASPVELRFQRFAMLCLICLGVIAIASMLLGK